MFDPGYGKPEEEFELRKIAVQAAVSNGGMLSDSWSWTANRKLSDLVPGAGLVLGARERRSRIS